MYTFYFQLFYELARLSTFFYSPESFVLAILYAVVNYYLLKLLDKPALKRAFQEFSFSKDHIKYCAIIFVTCNLLRTGFLGMVGKYSIFIHNSFWEV